MPRSVPQQRFLLRVIQGCFFGSLLLLLGIGASSCTPLIQTPTPIASSAQPNTEPVEARLIVQVHYPTVEILNSLAGELDIWEVDRAAQTFVARITLEQYDALLQQGLTVDLDCAKMRQYEQPLDGAIPTVAQLMQEQCPASSS